LQIPVDAAGDGVWIAKDLVDQFVERFLLVGRHLNLNAVFRAEGEHFFVGVGFVKNLNVVVHGGSVFRIGVNCRELREGIPNSRYEFG